eukprot:7766833-Alexandrium_andersonii.AAC.1
MCIRDSFSEARRRGAASPRSQAPPSGSPRDERRADYRNSNRAAPTGQQLRDHSALSASSALQVLKACF